MMLLFALYLAVISHLYYLTRKLSIKNFVAFSHLFLPAVAICFYWLFKHYQLTGWIGFHNDSPWASSFKTVGIEQVFKNLFLMIWRYGDFGRITVWLVCIGSRPALAQCAIAPAPQLSLWLAPALSAVLRAGQSPQERPCLPSPAPGQPPPPVP